MNQSSSVTSYPPSQKYARLSVAQVPRRRSDSLRQPVSTFRSLAFLHKKPKHRTSELDVKKKKKKQKCGRAITYVFSSECFSRKKQKKEDDSKYFVFKQPGQEEGISFADYAAQLIRKKRKFLLSEMSRVQPYDMDLHCWRDWGHTRILDILSQPTPEIPGTKTKVDYRPPKLSEQEVCTLQKSSNYMREAWEEWALARYPNGGRVHGPPLP